ncbi:MAG: hypothetical protein H6R24_2421 [Proteobacteria bacterium]|nr:hypothetical protein [Pseudomonadota bacterium]
MRPVLDHDPLGWLAKTLADQVGVELDHWPVRDGRHNRVQRCVGIRLGNRIAPTTVSGGPAFAGVGSQGVQCILGQMGHQHHLNVQPAKHRVPEIRFQAQTAFRVLEHAQFVAPAQFGHGVAHGVLTQGQAEHREGRAIRTGGDLPGQVLARRGRLAAGRAHDRQKEDAERDAQCGQQQNLPVFHHARSQPATCLAK